MAEQQTNATALSASEKFYMQLNASELSAFIMKGSPHSNDRDAGFCSGSSEGGDDLSMDHSPRLNPCSPTDASEDSVEVKVLPIELLRNKRKSMEPSKVVLEREEAPGPLKKRVRYTCSEGSAVVMATPPAVHFSPQPPPLAVHFSPQPPPPAVHFSPPPPPPPAAMAPRWLPHEWMPHEWMPHEWMPHEWIPHPAHVFVRHPGVTTLHRLPPAFMEDVQQEPLALVVRKKAPPSPTPTPTPPPAAHGASSEEHIDVTTNGDATPLQMPVIAARKMDAAVSAPSPPPPPPPPRPPAAVSAAPSLEDEHFASGSSSSSGARPHQRNYKNMTRERRIEANARERTRVHTISAAYETLRRAVPSYSDSQKLSKLSVLRVACSYILTLSRMVGEDYSADQSRPSVSSCFDAITATIQTEGKIRKKKDD